MSDILYEGGAFSGTVSANCGVVKTGFYTDKRGTDTLLVL